MSASEAKRAEWPGKQFWDRLDRLESRHQRIHSEHELVRRDLDSVKRAQVDELRRAWHRYCEVIAELDRATAELELLRTNAR